MLIDLIVYLLIWSTVCSYLYRSHYQCMQRNFLVLSNCTCLPGWSLQSAYLPFVRYSLVPSISSLSNPTSHHPRERERDFHISYNFFFKKWGNYIWYIYIFQNFVFIPYLFPFSSYVFKFIGFLIKWTIGFLVKWNIILFIS